MLKCEEVTTIPKDWLDERPLSGPLSAARLRDVAAALVRAIDLDFTPSCFSDGGPETELTVGGRA
jgi:hypothetical protein